jgi:hypothetical protein
VAELRDAVAQADLDVVLAAAWLHDTGYAADLHDSGFHPLDGARFLEPTGWPARICALVAHHSGARYVASVRGLGQELGEFPREVSPAVDALTYADQTVGVDGIRTDVVSRMADMLRRHGPDSDNARVHQLRAPDLLAVAQRVEHRLRGGVGPAGGGEARTG